MGRLEGRVAIVTGGAQGIGAAIAVEADVTDEASCNDMVAAAVEACGKLDIMVSNAGLYTHLERKDFTELDRAVWEQVMAVNVTGVWLSAKAAAGEMREHSYGKIINISSGRVFKGGSGLLHYDTSKGAVIAMTRSLARELGDDGIRVNAIAPRLTLGFRWIPWRTSRQEFP